MLLFIYGTRNTPLFSECCPDMEGQDAGRSTKHFQVSYCYIGF